MMKMSEINYWRGPRNKKITPEIKKKMNKLRDDGSTYKAIAKEFNVCTNTVHYHLNPRTRELSTLRARKFRKTHGCPSKRNPEKNRQYMREYMRERYRKDPDFHKKMDESHRKYMEKIRSSNNSQKSLHKGENVK